MRQATYWLVCQVSYNHSVTKNQHIQPKKHQKTQWTLLKLHKKYKWSHNWCHPNHLMSLLACKLRFYQYQWCTIVCQHWLCPAFPLQHYGKGEGRCYFFCGNSSPTWNKGICISRKVVTNLQPWSSCSDRYAGSISFWGTGQFSSSHQLQRFSSALTERNKTTSKYMMFFFRSLHRPE